ncbi:hypothetical protein ACEPAG_6319 [Sanghuangporus baumii]
MYAFGDVDPRRASSNVQTQPSSLGFSTDLAQFINYVLTQPESAVTSQYLLTLTLSASLVFLVALSPTGLKHSPHHIVLC